MYHFATMNKLVKQLLVFLILLKIHYHCEPQNPHNVGIAFYGTILGFKKGQMCVFSSSIITIIVKEPLNRKWSLQNYENQHLMRVVTRYHATVRH